MAHTPKLAIIEEVDAAETTDQVMIRRGEDLLVVKAGAFAAQVNNFSTLYGLSTNTTVPAAPSRAIVSGWDSKLEQSRAVSANNVAGIFSILASGQYSISGTLVGLQGDADKDFDFLLYISEQTPTKESVVAVYSVPQNAGEYRGFSFNVVASLPAGCTVRVEITSTVAATSIRWQSGSVTISALSQLVIGP